jgi:hypothetical protein
MRLETPEVLTREHRTLNLRLQALTPLSGSVGDAARRLVEILGGHLQREEQFAFPLLGLLPHLVNGVVGEEMAIALPVAERLRLELRRLREDHVAIVAAVEVLGEAARLEGKTEHAVLAYEVLEHARLEEAVLYPAALIVGEYVRLSLEANAAGAGRRRGHSA